MTRRQIRVVVVGSLLLVVGTAPPVLARGAPPDPGPITIAAVGDMILGSTPELPDHPERYLNAVRAELDADITFGNLEGTLTDGTDSKCSPGEFACFAFRNPPGYGRHYRDAGFDVLNTANNHGHDFGAEGAADTREALRRFGIVHAGLPNRTAFFVANGLRVAFLGYAPYPRGPNLLDLEAAAADIREASDEADLVVVYMHAGAEGSDKQHVTGEEEYFLGEDRGNPQRFARMAVRNGADLVLGSGPHVLRGMEVYRHRLIAYSLANFASYWNFKIEGVTSRSAILHATIGPGGWFRRGRIVPVRLSKAGHATVDPTFASVRMIRRLSVEDFGERAVLVLDRGVLAPPA